MGNQFLIVGGAAPFVPAEGCPVATEQFGGGAYMAHQGDRDSFFIADVRVRDDSAAVRVVVWRCVYCGRVLAGLGSTAPENLAEQDYAWMEEAGEPQSPN